MIHYICFHFKGVYDVSKHPAVIAGTKTADEVLKEFLETFDVDHQDGKVISNI